MLKLLGSGLVIFGCGMLGLSLAQGYRLRPLHLRNLQSALKMLETEIEYAATPLPEALAKIAGLADAPATTFFSQAAAALREEPGRPVLETWQQALKFLAAEGSLTAADLNILKSLGQTLGASDREDQLKNIELARLQLQEQEKQAEEEEKRQGRMWRTLGFLLGAALVLVFY
ncbi:MAG: stage sporulation protein [Clostridia bacterium]|nr:stage sporulation protein [Clostridia bacterium]